jgi:hypothetical protein
VSAEFSGDYPRKAPSTEATRWMQSHDTGTEGLNGTLKIGVKKDFACLPPDSPEDADSFPNPLVKSS